MVILGGWVFLMSEVPLYHTRSLCGCRALFLSSTPSKTPQLDTMFTKVNPLPETRYCESRLWLGGVFAHVGRNQNLKDLKDLSRSWSPTVRRMRLQELLEIKDTHRHRTLR